MERKTQINAEPGRQEILITRAFDLPVSLLFKAYTEPEFVAQWMGTKVLKLDNSAHGGYRFETSDAQGNVVFLAHGTIHEVVPDRSIIRTFEMGNVPFGVQLEYLEFEALTEERSRLNMQIIYRSTDIRDQQLKLPFAYGLNMAHDRLEDVVGKLR